MIHSEWFNLYEAMSALELMDPKMDAGANSDTVLTPNDRLQSGTPAQIDPITARVTAVFDIGELRLQLSPEEAVEIFDNLLRLELMWYDGNTLAQTIFTCLYMHPSVMTKLKELPLVDPPPADGEPVDGKVNVEGMVGLAVAAFGTCLLKTCATMRNVILRADIYEEEDFAPGTV
jgi:hypothetical protein